MFKKEDAFLFFTTELGYGTNLTYSNQNLKINESTSFLQKTIDLDLLLELDSLQSYETIEPMLLNTPSFAVDLEEYQKWSSIVSYVDGFLGKNEISATIDFLSSGLELPLSEAEYKLIKQEDIDLNLYKIAKQYKFYSNMYNPSISTFGDFKQSLQDTANITCFLLEDAQQRIIKTGFDDSFVNIYQSLKKGLINKS